MATVEDYWSVVCVRERGREGGRENDLFSSLQPQGSGKRLPEVYCIVSPLGCFSLYEKVD